MPPLSFTRGCFGLVLLGALWGMSPSAQAQVVPGTGNLLNYDNLEDANWSYVHNFPKSSKEEDENIRYPLGASNNRMWSESPKRGAPDVVKRIETPAGGLEGSTGSLYLRSRDTGIPGRPGNKQAQDDFVLAARPCGVGYSPNFVVRVFIPEFKDWEQRQGVSFGIRAGMQGMMTKQKDVKRLFGSPKKKSVTEMEPYYPGFFIAFNPVAANPAYKEDHAMILIRSDANGHEVAGPRIMQTGWWTFGMSVTPDSRCHYYAHAGTADLTAADHLYSSLPYGIKGEHFNTVFFNVCSADNASSWSTPWIIDDPKVFYAGQPVFKPAEQQAQQSQPVKTTQAPSSTPNAQNASLSKDIPAAPAVTPLTPIVPMQAPPVLTPPAQATPVQAAPASAPMQAVPVAPLPPAPRTPIILPAQVSTAPALLSTGSTVTLKPVSVKPAQPLQLPASSPGEQSTAPAAPGPLLILPTTPSAETGTAKPEPALTPEPNPFDTAQPPNVKPVAVKSDPASTAAPGGGATIPVTPPQDEPPLVIPSENEGSTKVDPAPIPLPPSE